MPNTIINLSPGVQVPPVVTGLSNITYVANGGLVTFSSPIHLGNTKNIIFDGKSASGLTYGFKYSGSDFSIFTPGQGNNQDLQVLGFDFGNTASQAFDVSTKIFISGVVLTYDGTPQKAVYTNLYVDTFKCAGKTILMTGTFEGASTYRMYVIGVTFKNGVFANTTAGVNTKISGGSIFGLLCDTWNITGPTINNLDCGIVYIAGSANLKNIYRNGGWGYLMRLIIIKLGGVAVDQTCAITHCIDVNSTHYGTIDIRNDPTAYNSSAAIPLTGGDFIFQNNTIGDKVDGADDSGHGADSYLTDAVVLGDMRDELGFAHKITMKNNIAWNADAGSGLSGGSSLFKGNTGPSTYVMDSGNNIDLAPGVPLPNGVYFVDKVNFVPLTGGPLDGTNIGAIATPGVPPIQTENVFSGQPNVMVCKADILFSDAGINAGNTSIIYEVGATLLSYAPGRTINAISGFQANKGYYIVPKNNLALSDTLAPPLT